MSADTAVEGKVEGEVADLPVGPDHHTRRGEALRVLALMASLVRPDMRADMGVTAHFVVSVQLDSQDPDDGRQIAEMIGLLEMPLRYTSYEHHTWEGLYRGHDCRVIVLTGLPVCASCDQRHRPDADCGAAAIEA